MIYNDKNTNNKISVENLIPKLPRIYSKMDYFAARAYFKQLFKEQK